LPARTESPLIGVREFPQISGDLGLFIIDVHRCSRVFGLSCDTAVTRTPTQQTYRQMRKGSGDGCHRPGKWRDGTSST
jgi:hypothetical protein